MGSEIVFKTNITFNGRKYASVEEMPAEIREIYERAIEPMPRSGADPLLNVSVKSKVRYVVNGQEYSQVADMPPAVQRLYRRALWKTAPVIFSGIVGVLLLAWLVVIVIRHMTSHP
jgi:hypothetical protein